VIRGRLQCITFCPLFNSGVEYRASITMIDHRTHIIVVVELQSTGVFYKCTQFYSGDPGGKYKLPGTNPRAHFFV
jgi:hypothetical protein